MKKILFGLSAIFFAISAYADNIDNTLLGADKNGDACQQIDNNTTICWKNQGGSVGGSNVCQDKNEGDDCSTTGTATAKCQTISGINGLRCTAKKCKSGYFLWVTSKRSNNVRSYEDYQSQGVCIPSTWCNSYCASCPDCTECKLHTFSWHGLDATDEICYQQKTQPEPQPAPQPDDERPEQQPDDAQPEPKPNTTPTKIGGASVYCYNTSCYESSVFERLAPVLNKHFTQTSVWKNESGEFNTARLASDSIAGVVLGTVGGIVTSKIIKKNQIKNGFEDLKCTINGQDIATYGDEFRVGIN